MTTSYCLGFVSAWGRRTTWFLFYPFLLESHGPSAPFSFALRKEFSLRNSVATRKLPVDDVLGPMGGRGSRRVLVRTHSSPVWFFPGHNQCWRSGIEICRSCRPFDEGIIPSSFLFFSSVAQLSYKSAHGSGTAILEICVAACSPSKLRISSFFIA